MESQLTTTTGLGDEYDLSSDEEEEELGVAPSSSVDVRHDDGEILLDYFFDGSNEEQDNSTPARNEMHGFSRGNEFEINERCSHYMDRPPITQINCQAVEKVYMIEAETLCRGENTMKKPKLMAKVFERYKALIHAIPASRFAQFSLQESMIRRCHNSKTENGSPSGTYKQILEAKSKVQAIIRKIPTLPKLPSGRDINDVRNDFILREYKAEMGKVILF